MIEVSGFEAKGGEVTIVGKVISTGKGQINVLDGYGTFNINNQSNKTIRMAGITNQEVEVRSPSSITAMIMARHWVCRVSRNIRVLVTIKVVNNDGSSLSKPTIDVSGLNNATGRSTTYTPRDGLRYNYMQAESVTIDRQFRTRRNKKGSFNAITWADSSDFRPPASDFREATALPASELPMVDYASLETSVTDEYRFRLVDDTKQTYSLTYEEQGTRNCFDIWIYQECTWYVLTDTTHEGNLYYFQDVTADRQIDIKFIGADQGSITVNSVGDIELASIQANGSNASLTSSGGNIITGATTNTLTIDNLTLSASGSVGTEAAPLTVIQDNSSVIRIDSGNGTFMQTATGNLVIDRLVNTDGNINLKAGQDLVLNTGTDALVGDNITLTAEFGQLSDASGNALRIDSRDNGSVSAYSRVGDLAMREIDGDMYVGQIDISGNLTLTIDNGSVLDGNLEQVDDTQTQSALLSLWNDLQLTGSYATTKKNNQVASFEDSMTNLYNDYWEMRNITEVNGSYVANPYDPNFAYTATADEQAALNNDPARIATFEAAQQARYQQGYEKFGDPSYDPNFSYSATSEEINVMTAGFAWEQDYLDAPLPNEAFKETTDTTAFIEAPNIKADNVTLTVTSGNIVPSQMSIISHCSLSQTAHWIMRQRLNWQRLNLMMLSMIR